MTVMKAEFINPFIKSLKDVINTMAQIKLKADQPIKKSSDVSKGDVTGLIGMIGPQVKGSMSISFEEKLAFNLMRSILGENPSEIDEGVTDMVGEITNMICGGAKSELYEEGYEFEMAVPMIVSGEKHVIHHKVSGPKILLPFVSKSGTAYLEICFNEAVDPTLDEE